MTITQDTLIKQISDKAEVDAATVRIVFKTADDFIFNCLSSSPLTENMTIKLFNGISLNRKYVEQKKYSKGMFKNLDCAAHVNIKGNISKYYSDKVNNEITLL